MQTNTMTTEETLQLYEELAGRFDRQQEPRHRDIFLVLAADAALTGARGDEAERLRARLLQSNPHHLLKPFATMREAMQSGDIRDYVADLRRRYPTPHAEELLAKLRTKDPAPLPAFDPLPEQDIPVFQLSEEPPPPPRSAPRIDAPPRRTTLRGGEPRTIPLAPADPVRKRTPTRSPYETEPAQSPSSADEPEAAGRWFATLLFVLTLLFGLGLAAFVFVRPFLP